MTALFFFFFFFEQGMVVSLLPGTCLEILHLAGSRAQVRRLKPLGERGRCKESGWDLCV